MDQNQLANLTPQQKEELMQTVQAQVALSNMQVWSFQMSIAILSPITIPFQGTWGYVP